MTCMYSAMVNRELFEWFACMLYDVSANNEHFRYCTQTFHFVAEHFEIVRKAAEIFAELPIGKLLASVEGAQSLDILRLYVIDFVHMVYPVQTEDECKVIIKPDSTSYKRDLHLSCNG